MCVEDSLLPACLPSLGKQKREKTKYSALADGRVYSIVLLSRLLRLLLLLLLLAYFYTLSIFFSQPPF
jgi:hypothetical protein